MRCRGGNSPDNRAFLNCIHFVFLPILIFLLREVRFLMDNIRSPAVAGLFYPNDSQTLRNMVQGFIKEAKTSGKPPKALIAPHAGYVYSGPVAASVYALLPPVKNTIRKVVLIGPSHRVGFRGIAFSSAESYATPLGLVPIDRTSLEKIRSLPFVGLLDQAHAQEHSLEVHLPFLQEVLGTFELIPLVAGDATPEQVCAVLEQLWGGPETLIVISSDLSHYQDYATAQKMDCATSEAIENLEGDRIDRESACGRVPIKGLLYFARKKGFSVKALDVRNSGDTAGNKDRVVGYGAYVLECIPRALQRPQQVQLLAIAKASIRYGLQHGRPLTPNLPDYPEELRVLRATFVTLQLESRLRGCIGSLEARRPMVADVAYNAFAAAFQDPRFPPVTEADMERLEIHLSLLTPPLPMTFSSEADLLTQIVPGKDGLILADGTQRGTFLPSVWESLPDRVQFLEHLKLKAGLSRQHWSDSIRIWRYEAELVE